MSATAAWPLRAVAERTPATCELECGHLLVHERSCDADTHECWKCAR